ncbi:undecaprenyldiphospho-muramoylpentapeptide beta-N-acetylglucosaminyltransferase [Gloeobacter kilaueensis]|uniref:UDP-N-acetylglucosamine--N-acetylmuramyl-(pentapeptide) pyrophosphoryl-undecaprenol N-acetylglucosamine transferase n=1 Tax=Gloeobacter kilaueensis (strain ATCC BAA-2537 / CCAP 1431/1 / ULC 316 / JS1) TaxID=1183438 RepID=U5QH50_GLOK1|nr:undecaprenyldiphospho-muramoylpentapeptide beta-N-acetylglucosaminyltransferase [Gloeobacter kilaueensis]AGY58218.1 UDP-N-acetylglucosamine--N-acetylmuramyl-(pentapeptide) pyrophosphoryl-undecaprenol N-acetylglucosamine transferase [Gloeobacter kilaueensis JS1]
MNKPRLLIAASGTGGHIFPALAVAAQLSGEFEIAWLGVPDRLETKLVPERYRLHTVRLQGLNRRPGPQWLSAASQLLGAYRFARRLLKAEGFSGVFTTGGYIAAPAVLAARALGLPAVGHESNALPGKVTRTLARWMACLGLGFAEAAEYIPGIRSRWVGTPVREEFLRSPNPLLEIDVPPEAPLIVVLGGSQGARAINQLVVECAPGWLARGWQIVHVSGAGEFEAVRSRAPVHPAYHLYPFWEKMAPLLARADLAISRAGAATLSELLVSGTPAVLIPFPYAAEDHQRINAEVLVRSGAALHLPQATLNGPLLDRTVAALFADADILPRMARSARALAVPDAASRTADLVRECLGLRTPVG